MKKGDKVQVWDEDSYKPLGWGTVVEIAVATKDLISGKTPEGIPLIQLESGKKVWGDRCSWIEEKKAIGISVRLFRNIHEKIGPAEEEAQKEALSTMKKK